MNFKTVETNIREKEKGKRRDRDDKTEEERMKGWFGGQIEWSHCSIVNTC